MIYLLIYLIIGLILAGIPTYKDLKRGGSYEPWTEWRWPIGFCLFWPAGLVWAWFVLTMED